MYGPNTNIVVNGSIIFFSECETRYIMGCIELMLRKRLCRDGAANATCTTRSTRRSTPPTCRWPGVVPQVTSWYKNAKGRVTQNWPFPLVDYWDRTRAPNPSDFEFETKSAVAAE